MINYYKKRFPADWEKSVEQQLTFLNDKKIDAELYLYLISFSVVEQDNNGAYQTITYKKVLPSQTAMGNVLGIKSRTTLKTHLEYLVEREYIEEYKDRYVFVNPETKFFDIPIDTIEFLKTVAKEKVVKAFICLGQWWNFKQSQFLFTREELGKHIGINMESDGGSYGYKAVDHILIALEKFGFIKYVEFKTEEGKNRVRLSSFNVDCPKKDNNENN